MKMNFSIIVLCLLSLIICDEEGGVKIAVNDGFINSILLNFEEEIKDLLKGVRIDDTDSLTNLVFAIPNFSLDKMELFFDESGFVNLKLRNLEPILTGTVHYTIIWDFSNDFKITLKDFWLDAKIRITTKELAPGVYMPNAEFVSDPDMDFIIELDVDGTIASIIAKIFNFAGDFAKKYILPVMKDKIHELLAMVLDEIPTEVEIGDYWLDLTLAAPVKLNNKFLQVNSYALLFSKEYPETQNKTRYALSNFPSITDNQFQAFVSEYSLNSAAYTYLTVNSKEALLSYTISTGFVNVMLPGIAQKYGMKDSEISLIPKPETNIKLFEEYMVITAPSTFLVKVDGFENPVFVCELNLILKAVAKVEKGPKFSAVITDLVGEIGEIFVNEATTSPIESIEKGFLTLKAAIVNIANAYIKQYVDFPIPSIMGISLTDIEIKHKDEYILLNFNITRDGE